MRADYLLNTQMELILAGMTRDNALVLRVMLRTGLRISDVLNLKVSQLSRCFWVTEQKTGKRRAVGLTDELIKELERNAGKSEWCFPSPYDKKKHKTRQAVWADMKRVSKALRLPVNASTHSARKVYAVELMHKYGDILEVQRALNHDNPTVTVLYAMADVLVQTLPYRKHPARRVRRKAT